MRTRLTSLLLAVTIALPVTAASQPKLWRDRAMTPYKAGLEHMEAEAWDEAARSFRAAIDIDATFELAHYMLGRVHMAQKQFPSAAAAFVRTRDLYRDAVGREFTGAQDAQLTLRDRIAEIDELIQQLQSRLQTTRTQDQLRQLNDQKQRLRDSMQRRDGGMSIKQSVPAFVTLSLGSAYFRMGDLVQAEKAYNESIDADPRSGEAYNNLAVVYLQTGRVKDAERAVKSAEKSGYRVHPQLKEDIRNRKNNPA